MSRRLALGISVVWVPLAFLGDGLTTLVLPSALASGTSATSLGLLSFAGLGIGVAIQPLLGRLSDRLRDRVDRRAFMEASALPALVALGLLAVAETFPLIAVAFLGAMIAASAIQAAQQTLIPEHVAAPLRGRAASLKTAFDIGGAFLGFLLLGWLLEAGGVGAATAAIALALIVAIVLVVMWVPTAPRLREGDAPIRSNSLPDGLGQLVLARFLFLLGIYAVGRFMLLLVAERLGIHAASAAAETGGLLALFTLVTAIAALAIGPMVDGIGRSRVMVIGAVVAAAGTALFVPQLGLPGVVVAGCLMSFGTAAFMTANWAAVTDISPARDAGRILGLANFGTGGAAACAGLFGPSIDAWGFAPALILATILILGALLPSMRPVRAGQLEPTT